MSDEKHGACDDDGHEKGEKVNKAPGGEDGLPDMIAEELEDSGGYGPLWFAERRDERGLGRGEAGDQGGGGEEGREEGLWTGEEPEREAAGDGDEPEDAAAGEEAEGGGRAGEEGVPGPGRGGAGVAEEDHGAGYDVTAVESPRGLRKGIGGGEVGRAERRERRGTRRWRVGRVDVCCPRGQPPTITSSATADGWPVCLCHPRFFRLLPPRRPSPGCGSPRRPSPAPRRPRAPLPLHLPRHAGNRRRL